MKLNELKNNPGATKARKRVGRGIGSGKGKTAGAGHKGQKARTGVSIKGFEGGQMPLYMRLPKRGFKNIFKKRAGEINLVDLQEAISAGKLDGQKKITREELIKAGLVRKNIDLVKLLGKGELTVPVELEINAASASAKKAIEKAKGVLTLIAIEAPHEEKVAKPKKVKKEIVKETEEE